MRASSRLRRTPALRRFDLFVGTSSMEGHLVGSDDNTITGDVPYDIGGSRLR